MKLFKRLHSSGGKQNSSASFRSASKDVPAAGTHSSGSSTLSESSDALSHSQPSPSAQQNLLRLHSDRDRSSPLGPSRRQYLSVEVYPVPGAGAGNLSGSSGPPTPAPSPSPSSSQLERRSRLSRQEATTFQESAANVSASASVFDSQQGHQLPLECLATPARHSRNQQHQQLLLAPSPIGFMRRGPSDSDRQAPDDRRRRVKSSNTSTPPNSPSFMKEPQRAPKEVRSSAGAEAASKQQSSGRFSMLKLGRKLGFMRSKASASGSNFSSYCEPGSTGTSSQLSSVDQSCTQFGLSIDTESTAGPPSFETEEQLDAGAEYKSQSLQSYRISRSFDVAFGTQPQPQLPPSPSANAEVAASPVPVAEEKTPVETKRHIFQKKKFSMGSAFDTLPRRVPVPHLLPTLPITPAESMRSIECFQEEPIRCSIDCNHSESSTDAPRQPRVPLIRTLDMSGAECDADADTDLFRAATSSSGGACYAELSIAVPAPDTTANVSIKRSHSARFADSNQNPNADAGSGTTIRPRTTTTTALCPNRGPRLGPVAALLHSRSTAAIGAGSASKACPHAQESCRSARVERSRSIAEAPCFEGPEQTGAVRNASPDAQNGAHSGVRLREESEEDSEEEEEEEEAGDAEEDIRPATLDRCYSNHELRLLEKQCYLFAHRVKS